MENTITFILDGKEVTAEKGLSIWEIAKQQGTLIPHLCHKDAIGYRSDVQFPTVLCWMTIVVVELA